MRAVIVSTGDWPGTAPLNEYQPAPLLPLADRPFLQHVIEYLASRNVKQFDLFLSHLPEKFRHFLGDGKRWGCKITDHLIRDSARPYRRLRALSWDEGPDGLVLLVHADRLPLLPGPESFPPDCATLYVHSPQDDSPAWTGWAVLRVAQLTAIPADADEAGLRDYLDQLLPVEIRRAEVPHLLNAVTFSGLLAAHQLVLDRQFDGLLFTGREVEPGIWLSRNVVLHPTAQLAPPVYIGENCEIGEAVKLGPHATVGHGSVIDARSTVTNSVIFPGSYVGEGLELADVLVDKNRLINPRMGAAVTVTDNFILGNLAEQHFRRWLLRQTSRLCGLLLLLLALPLLLLTALWLRLTRSGPVLFRKEVVRLPASPDEINWKTYFLWSFVPFDGTAPPLASRRGLFLRFIPALVNVALGHLSFVGVRPRSREEIKHLPRDWQMLCLAGKAGVVTEASVIFGDRPTEDDLFATETVYIASAGLRHDLKLLVGYFFRAVFEFGTPVALEEPGGATLTPG